MSEPGVDVGRGGDPFPQLSDQQVAGLAERGRAMTVQAGEILYQAGDPDYDFIVIESGDVEIVRPPTPDDPREAVIARHGAGRFLGEWNLVTGQAVYVTARVVNGGVIHRIPPLGFRQLLAEDVELADVIVGAFLARRAMLQAGEAASSVEILGSALSAAAHDLRTWAARQRLVHAWYDIDEPAGQRLAQALGVGADDLPVVVTATATLIRTTPGVVAEHLGLSYRPGSGTVYDVVVIGAGPAGLAAAVYGSSEGLRTLLLDSTAVGGQAAASSRIENYLGFPTGVSGAELTARGLLQAQKFGAQVSTPCEVTRLSSSNGELRITLADGADIHTRAVVIATGAAYRTLPLEGWARFEGAGIYYAATEMEARACSASPVAVVGGANSAGQAALFLADRTGPVKLIVRGSDLGAEMSAYLVQRLLHHPRITLHTGSEVTALHGEASLTAVTVTDRAAGTSAVFDSGGLFCFIGAHPATTWLTEVCCDDDGFVFTDEHLADELLSDAWRLLGRRPLPFETSVPGVFAVGDVRLGSMKRVAAAVGEGASAIGSVHRAIASS